MSQGNPFAVQANCECPAPLAPIPSVAAVPVETDVVLTECFTSVCGVCDETIVPAPPTFPPITAATCCFQFDPAYCGHWVRVPENSGLTLMIIAVDPARGAIVKGGKICETLCEDADILDIFSQYKVGDHEYSWFPSIQVTGPPLLPAATVPLKFFVDPIFRDRINSERGYVILGNKNWPNEWQPRDRIENAFLNTADQPFPLGSLNLSLDPVAALIGNTIGTAPLIKVVVPFRPIARGVQDTTAIDTLVNLDLAAAAFSPGGATIVPGSLLLIDPADGIKKTSVTIADVIWDATAGDGTVNFTPSNGVTGTFSIDFCISDDTPLQSLPATATVVVS